MKYPRVPFSEALTDATGGQVKVQKRDYLDAGLLPVIDQGQAEIGGYTDDMTAQANVPLPVILFGDHTRTFKFADSPFAVGADGLKVLVPREGFDAEYLFFYLQSVDLPNHSYSRHFKFLKEISVPKPPLPEQRRIVDILNHAAGIRRLRQQALEKTRALIHALFVDMFGDPASNLKGWEVVELGEHVEIVSVVKTPNIEAEGAELCIGPDSIESKTGRLVSTPTVRDVLPRSGKYRFVAGEVLYSKIRPYLAKATIAPTDGYCSADMYPLRCKKKMLPEFLLNLLLSPAFTAFASNESIRARMPKLNREMLFSYLFPLPPVELQQQFSNSVADARSLITQQERHLAQAEALMQSLMARFFGG